LKIGQSADAYALFPALIYISRFKSKTPILLTAAAATLALIPIAHEVFWGPMAYAMMGGIVVGTILTLLFLPALYVAWFRMSVQTQA
jgi:multidrug efflux pump subunit AcrB